MRLDHRVRVKLFLVPEMVVDRRDIRPGSRADRPYRRRVVSLLGELLTRRIEEPRLRCVHARHRHLALEQSFQTTVSSDCMAVLRNVKTELSIPSCWKSGGS